ncbi:hypothetical protein A3D05_06140 [Candidatus Gottesmanbacteria bacterium RIFCSPHIGHO2_02_FULL_40_24]|uniref:Cohesin domain-containing protein n=1 Tax=Candidatus Gottesmanbacteria bacterium RIFCSPHIGHO2_01_FULL_40_15 TaxID=1798376 RepID=A0A1F5YZH1_9BACT|nr:MAG: hypothetical protein A2777_03425 [Candidatus Gottesmanbacteria bacterium RIFCSPHIGHO2_01_FULL_40_15]OGG17570.1 MAG: hypothetical protein A3D05_06140 [Candidatus Gottesmanbacteria bacterium RIFCSPHIGHO2_02_FULL_40_24]OGG22059.1 MAG: hypothetical protein A3B48_00020 [Candidatus Gottesmanbacteria bacterium RIFCSPLOWO2_01_FULL_40_10]
MKKGKHMNNNSDIYKQNPLYKRNLHLEEFYQNKSDELLNQKIIKTNLGKNIKKYVLIAFILISFLIPSLMVYITSKQQDARIRATANRAKLFLFPKDINLNKKETFDINPKLVGGNDKKIAAIIFSLQFDNSQLELNQIDLEKIGNVFGNRKITSTEEANREGKVKFFLGAGDLASAPSGTVDLPKISFSVKKETETDIDFIKGDTQIIFTSQESAEVEFDTPVRIKYQKKVETPPEEEIRPSEEEKTEQNRISPSLEPEKAGPAKTRENEPAISQNPGN